MNKKYIKPEATVIEISMEGHLLAESDPTTIYDEISTSPDMSKTHNTFDIWGSDDEE
ncbi:MAG: toxin PIN [Prevotella sp.]|nr:toxin PIN [Prevotella sp.]